MRISRQFRRALESELRRLMEQGGASLVWEVKADHRAGAREMSRRLQQLGYPTKLSGNTVTLSVDPIEHSKMQALINRIQRGGMDVSYSLKFGPAPKYDRTLRRISAKEAAGTEPMTPDERRDAYSNLRVTLNGKPADISGFRNRFATVWARGVGSAEWSWDAVERIVKAGGRFKAEIF